MTATTPMVMLPGTVIGGYRILDVIGIGGMAIVYRAEQISLGREVALKVLSSTLSSDADFRERFRREGQTVAALEHPNIVPIHDFGDEDGQLFLVMHLVRGVTLAARMRLGNLTAKEVMALIRPIADALAAAHAASVVHRDIKPQNILLSATGQPFLADFGVAKSGTAVGLTATGGFVGSNSYASPEQILGRPVSAATDVYSLTATLFQCFTGQLPYIRDTEGGVLHAHVTEPPPAVTDAGPGVAEFNELIARGMAKDPAARFATVGELLDAVVALVSALPPERLTRSPTFGDGAQPSTAPPPVDLSDETEARSRVPRSAGAETLADRRRTPAADGERPARARSRGRRRAWLAAGVGATIAVVAAVALAVGLAGAPAVATARSGPFTLRYRSPWHPWRNPSGGSVVASPEIALSAGGSTLLAGALRRSPGVPGAAPPALSAQFGRPELATAATVAGRPGREYAWTHTGGQVVAIVLPTTTGDLALVCTSGHGAVGSQCAAFARQARVATVTAIPPGADPALRRRLRSLLGPLAADRARLRGLDAHQLTQRATGALALARTEQALSSRVHRLAIAARYRRSVSPLAAAIAGEAKAFASVAAAARHDSRHGYARAVVAVSAASRRLGAAAAGMSTVGLETVRLAALRLPALPKVVPPRKPKKCTAGTAGCGQATTTTTTTPVEVNPGGPATGVTTEPSPAYVPPATVVTPPAATTRPRTTVTKTPPATKSTPPPSKATSPPTRVTTPPPTKSTTRPSTSKTPTTITQVVSGG